ncbi:Sodium/calcium exchanger 3, partial [Cichlidogyrus casuarinus]
MFWTSAAHTFSYKLAFFVIFCGSFDLSLAVKLNENGTCSASEGVKCKAGVVLPLWLPVTNLSRGDMIARSVVYFAALMYMFLGVSIIADRFMASIEVITSKEKEIIVKKKNGERQIISVRIWNETVSNLTLMALGSSAPEILLSIIEIIGANFEAGDLGPGTIVGSAAFNLFIIIGLCILVIPENEVRRIKHISVFFITATFIISPMEIEVWEAVLTFSFFPITVIAAYIADTKIFFKKFLQKRYTPASKIKARCEGEMELGASGDVKFSADVDSPEDNDYERHRIEYVEAIKEIRKRHPNIDTKQLEEMAQMEVLNKGPKSRAFYRMQATRQIIGSGNVIKKSKVEKVGEEDEVEIPDDGMGPEIQRVYFDPGHYTVMENVGTFRVYVTRENGDMDSKISVDYCTEDGSAKADEDYLPSRGTLIFNPGDKHQHFSVSIIDDDIFEEDEHFSVRLSNLRVLRSNSSEQHFKLVEPMTATIMVLDDDHSGVFLFETKEMDVSESIGQAEIKVIRTSGGRGHVRLPYQTVEATAKGHGQDFYDETGFLEFENDQTEAFIRIRIVDDNDYEKNEFFYIQLGEPILVDKDPLLFRPKFRRRKNVIELSQESQQLEEENKAEKEISDADGKNLLSKMIHHISEDKDKYNMANGAVGNLPQGLDGEIDTGKPRLGEFTRIQVHIKESDELKNTVDRLMKNGKMALVVSTSSWKEQFIEAITVSAGGDPEGEEGDEIEEKLPSCTDYVMHFLTIFWKVLFAFVPPTDYAGGWLCFVVSITMIGVLTAVIGDLANGFGCNVGLTDAVNAITFVAIGTSLP